VSAQQVVLTDAQARWQVGDWAQISGLHGQYKVKGHNRDGSVLLYGGSWGRQYASLSFRSVMPARLTHCKSPIRSDDD
jgi:hypothetical protein